MYFNCNCNCSPDKIRNKIKWYYVVWYDTLHIEYRLFYVICADCYRKLYYCTIELNWIPFFYSYERCWDIFVSSRLVYYSCTVLYCIYTDSEVMVFNTVHRCIVPGDMCLGWIFLSIIKRYTINQKKLGKKWPWLMKRHCRKKLLCKEYRIFVTHNEKQKQQLCPLFCPIIVSNNNIPVEPRWHYRHRVHRVFNMFYDTTCMDKKSEMVKKTYFHKHTVSLTYIIALCCYRLNTLIQYTVSRYTH